jgi:predicted HAD superfamily Cof-like phosphohydrolase
MKKLLKSLFKNRTWYDDVKDFQLGADQKVSNFPVLPSESERNLRINLLEEEFKEYMHAETIDDIVEIADALADMIYIICGTAASYGIPLDKVFDEVHKSNMKKFVNGKATKRSDGKILKPEGWKAPNIKQYLQ